MLDFTQLQNRYILTGTIELQHAMHVGSGRAGETVDDTFVKTRVDAINKETVYIPGSSLRGALRSLVERILMALQNEVTTGQILSCALISGKQCITVNKDQQIDFDKLIEDRESEEKLWNDLIHNNRLCRCCQVFGSTHLASRVRISDLYPVKANGNPELIARGEDRFGVGIDRETGTAKEGVLFTIEAVNKGNLFGFELIAENMEPNDWGILGIGLMELLEGRLHVGAKSAIGLGRCQLLKDSLKLEYFDGSGEGSLIKYLKGEEPTKLVKENVIDNFLKPRIESFIKEEV